MSKPSQQKSKKKAAKKKAAKKKTPKKTRSRPDLSGIRSFVADVKEAIHREASDIVARTHGHTIHRLTVMNAIPGALLALLYIVFNNFRNTQINDNTTLTANQQSLSRHQLEMDKNTTILMKLAMEEYGEERMAELLKKFHIDMGIVALVQWVVPDEVKRELLMPDPEEIPEDVEKAFKPDDQIAEDGAAPSGASHPDGATFFGGGEE